MFAIYNKVTRGIFNHECFIFSLNIFLFFWLLFFLLLFFFSSSFLSSSYYLFEPSSFLFFHPLIIYLNLIIIINIIIIIVIIVIIIIIIVVVVVIIIIIIITVTDIFEKSIGREFQARAWSTSIHHVKWWISCFRGLSVLVWQNDTTWYSSISLKSEH